MKIHTIHDEDQVKVSTEIKLKLECCKYLSSAINDQNIHEPISIHKFWFIARMKCECLEELLKCILVHTTTEQVEIEGRNYGFIEHNNRLHDLEFILIKYPR